MRRSSLLALLFFLTAWAALAQMVVPSSEVSSAAAPAHICPDAGVPAGTGDSDTRWDAPYRPTVSVTDSLWKFSGVHADLAGAGSRDVFVATLDRTRRGGPTPGLPAHLPHIPLLI